MKKILALIGVAALLATVNNVQAAAGDPSYNSTSISFPSVIPAANSPTNFASPVGIYVGKQGTIRFSFAVASKDPSSTTNVTFKAAWAIDTSTTTVMDTTRFDTNNSITLTACVNGTNYICTCTNALTVNGAGYLYIYQESIGWNSQVTNGPCFYGTALNRGN
jgi:hypothetical protein